MGRWQQDKAWADRYLPAIEQVIRQVAGNIITVTLASDEDDWHRATDYIVRVEAGDIACRVRRESYHSRFRDFTLRCSRPSGAVTELEKIKQGLARWYLYAWAREDGTFVDWVFVDLDRLRRSGLLFEPRKTIANKDGSSAFVSFSLSELRTHGCIVAQGEQKEPESVRPSAGPLPVPVAWGTSEDDW